MDVIVFTRGLELGAGLDTRSLIFILRSTLNERNAAPYSATRMQTLPICEPDETCSYALITSNPNSLSTGSLSPLRPTKRATPRRSRVDPPRDPPDDGAPRQREGRSARHPRLPGLREEPDDGHVPAHLHGADALGDGAGAAVLEDVVHALAVCESQDLPGLLWVRLVVHHVVGAVFGFDEIEL